MSNKLKKFEQTIFYLLILFLPTQLGFHFWPDFSYVYGLRIDYLSPTIYLTDILILLLLITFLIKWFLYKKKINFNSFKKNNWLFVWLFLIISGIIISRTPLLGAYGLLKLLEFIFFGIYTAKILSNKNVFKKTVLFLAIGVIFEGLLSVGQFYNQSSLNGLFYFLGERTFSGQTIGIANASLNGQLVLRPYATFSHPNVLASFLLLSLVFIYFAPKYKRKIIYYLAFVIGLISLMLTMSRIAIILCLLLIFLFVIKKSLKKETLILLLIIFLVIITSPLRFRFIGIGFDDLAITQRYELMQASLLIIKNNFIIGTGINNYFIHLADCLTVQKEFFLQPVHNIFLLIAMQTGFFGLVFFMWYLKKTIYFIKEKTKDKKVVLAKTILFCLILTLGFFDHYFLTIQQGQLLFSLTFGFLWSEVKSFS